MKYEPWTSILLTSEEEILESYKNINNHWIEIATISALYGIQWPECKYELIYRKPVSVIKTIVLGKLKFIKQHAKIRCRVWPTVTSEGHRGQTWEEMCPAMHSTGRVWTTHTIKDKNVHVSRQLMPNTGKLYT